MCPDCEVLKNRVKELESDHRGFCTHGCQGERHTSGCYEQMLNALKTRLAALEQKIRDLGGEP